MTDIYIYMCVFLINRAGVQLKTDSQQHIAPVIVQYHFFFFSLLGPYAVENIQGGF